MTAYYGVNNTLQYQTVPSSPAGVGEKGGRIRVDYDSFTITAALTTSDSISFMKIPKGARILDVVINSADAGGSGTMNIGWAASSDAVEAANATGFYSALDLSGQAVIARLSEVASAAGLHKKFAAECQLVMVPQANFSGTSGDIKVHIEYVLD